MQLSDLMLNRNLYKDPLVSSILGVDNNYQQSQFLPLYDPFGDSGGSNSTYDVNTSTLGLDGTVIVPGSIPPGTFDISDLGWTSTPTFSISGANTVNWTSGVFTSASGTAYSISSGTTGAMSVKTYIYLDISVSTTAYQITTNVNTPVGVGKVLIAVAQNGTSAATFNMVQATQITGDNILANSINASKITSGTITATQIASNTITTSNLNFVPVQGTNVIASINASVEGITISGSKVTINGTTTFASGYDPSAKIATGGAAADVNGNVTTISGGKITTGSITATQVAANAISADKLTAGTFNVGGTNQPTAIVIAQSTITGNARLGFQNNSRIWEDSSANMGFNAIGGTMVFYGNSVQTVQFTQGSQATFEDGIMCKNSFNVGTSGSSVDARVTGHIYLHPTIGNTSLSIVNSGNDIIYTSAGVHYFKNGGSEVFRCNSTGATTQGYFYSPNSAIIYLGAYSLNLTSNKTAIVPTSKGFNALYCTESPEVWFMDFCEEKGKLDPLFAEVTVSPYHYIKCEDGFYQVWGKRKGHENLRFENKTEQEFLANERFLNMNKPLINK